VSLLGIHVTNEHTAGEQIYHCRLFTSADPATISTIKSERVPTEAAIDMNSVKPLSVSVVIPTYERGQVLCDTVAMALGQDYPDFEVIVVDQSKDSPDGMKALVESSAGRLQYIKLPTPNLPAARNVGVRAAKGEIIVFIDDDIIIGVDYVASHVRNFLDPAVGAVMGVTLTRDGQSLPLTHFGLKRVFPDGTAQVTWVSGGNSSYRIRAIIEAGMSDERFTGTARCEDADLGVRVGHAGYKILFDPQIRLTHLEVPSGGCGNRAANRESLEEEHCRLVVFFCIKNATILGFGWVASDIWRMYRQYALTRPLLRDWTKFVTRQYLFAKTVGNAIRMCTEPL
jgi:glycosyltransferase involved in cell wall biosynthesis